MLDSLRSFSFSLLPTRLTCMIRQAFGRDHPIQAPPPRPHRPKRRATPSRRAPFSMEQLEPRVLLSADISYLPS
ncbi:MAG: LEPR-XLL domain-containing protein, partial [Hylemonella sp.]|nr:LEPR-XLL domain-containing protein [Hylemonella sp.]